MNETKRVHSIARKLGNSWTLRTIAIMLSLDILLLLLLGAGLIYYHETAVLGSQWEPGLTRELSPYVTLDSLSYRFRLDPGEWHDVPLRPIVEAILPFAGILLMAEGLMVIGEARRAHRKARKLLRPLDQISRDMEAFSRMQSDSAHYEDRLHDLEAAIENISPTLPDAKLRTGAQELTGLEDAINGLLMRMHESYRQQAQFVSDASHELRTPIAVIQGYAHMLARWGKDDAQVLEESISAIQSESNYMKKLVEELLFLARGEIGRNPFEPKPVSLTALIREVCDESAMIDPDHVWTFRGDSEIGISADPGMLKQCARVLCENAQKYTAKGGEITLSVHEDGERACFSVQDEGIGIAQDDVARIFDRFYRSDPARDRNSGGSGLGLSIAKWIVDRHSGYFEVLSREEIGTRFTVSLPK
ncbi:MAG: sensor histidine kinase [Clostridia bacterium]|nr:sensor histidine kinase [Clostridia bacterium]